jgi:hypothetical protein
VEATEVTKEEEINKDILDSLVNRSESSETETDSQPDKKSQAGGDGDE